MRRFAAGITGLASLCGLVLGFAMWSGKTVHASEDAASPEYYSSKVKPVLDANCARCHAGTFHRGGLNMDTRESLLKGGHSGPAIVPGDPANSLMVKLIRHEGPKDDPKDMPPNKPKLADADIDTISTWIKAGAVMPAAQ